MGHRILGPARQRWTGSRHGYERRSARALAWRRRSFRVCGAVRRLDGDESRIFFLCYHQVPRRDLAAFRSGLEALTAIGRFLSWDEALSLNSGERPVVGSHFCLTFDDGDRSWAEVVLPTLTDMSIPAAFFVVTGQGRPTSRALSWSSRQQAADRPHVTVGSCLPPCTAFAVSTNGRC